MRKNSSYNVKMGTGRILKYVADARYEQTKEIYILNQMEEKKVKNVQMPVKRITKKQLTRHFNVESSPSIPSLGKWPSS